jgi:flagellar motor switch protein FliN/FliY
MRIAVANNSSDEPERAPNNGSSALLDNVQVTLEAFLGKSRLRLADVRALKAGSVVTLDTSLTADVELHLNGLVVARGELVAAGDKFGVLLTEVGQ